MQRRVSLQVPRRRELVASLAHPRCLLRWALGGLHACAGDCLSWGCCTGAQGARGRPLETSWLCRRWGGWAGQGRHTSSRVPKAGRVTDGAWRGGTSRQGRQPCYAHNTLTLVSCAQAWEEEDGALWGQAHLTFYLKTLQINQPQRDHDPTPRAGSAGL